MSHFSRIKTKMVLKDHLIKALEDMGHRCETGRLEIRGFGGRKTDVEIRVPTGNPGYEIGFKRTRGGYELIADWWGIHNLAQDKFLSDATQRYAYHATRAKLEEQGFSLVEESKEQDGKVRLLLRRWV